MSYRTPKLSEFVQGFEYEVYYEFYVHPSLLDIKRSELTKLPRKVTGSWCEQKVWWDRPPEMKTVKLTYGVIMSLQESPQYDLRPPYSIQEKLNRGHIRVKQ